MKFLFGFHETLEVFINGVLEPAENATDAQRISHKNTKKKECKATFCIQSAVYTTNSDWISHDESTKEAWDILVKYYKGGKKF